MYHSLIVVAESSRARLYGLHKLQTPLDELMDFADTEQRVHVSEKISAQAGRAYDSSGDNRHAMEPRTEIDEKEALNFAKQINDYIDTLRNKHEFKQIILIAPPHFLGLLRKKLDAQNRKLVEVAIDKNLVQLQESELRDFIQPLI